MGVFADALEQARRNQEHQEDNNTKTVLDGDYLKRKVKLSPKTIAILKGNLYSDGGIHVIDNLIGEEARVNLLTIDWDSYQTQLDETSEQRGLLIYRIDIPVYPKGKPDGKAAVVFRNIDFYRQGALQNAEAEIEFNGERIKPSNADQLVKHWDQLVSEQPHS